MNINKKIEDIENDENGITVILWVYKRPYSLVEQLQAIENQTIKAKEIWIVQDWNFFDIPQDIHDNYKVYQVNQNSWVWFRFTVALLAKTKYICMMDDDTIPWNKRLENCLNESNKQRGLYGTIGLRYWLTWPKEHYYSHKRWGWANPNEVTIPVDIVGHSWFFEREFLSSYFREPLLPQFWMCWEDMHLSYSIQKYLWLWTYVPPHPKKDLEMRGSKKGWELGTKDSSRVTHASAKSWWKINGEWDCYDTYHKMLLNKDFKLLTDYPNGF